MSFRTKQLLAFLTGIIIIVITFKVVFPNAINVIPPHIVLTPIPTQSFTVGNTSIPHPLVPSTIPLQFPTQKCILTTNGQTSTIYTKDTNVRIDFQTGRLMNITNIILTNKKVYFWNADSKQGRVLDINTINNNFMLAGYVNNLLDAYNKQKNNCQQMTIPDSLFIVPQQVTFMNNSGL